MQMAHLHRHTITQTIQTHTCSEVRNTPNTYRVDTKTQKSLSDTQAHTLITMIQAQRDIYTHTHIHSTHIPIHKEHTKTHRGT